MHTHTHTHLEHLSDKHKHRHTRWRTVHSEHEKLQYLTLLYHYVYIIYKNNACYVYITILSSILLRIRQRISKGLISIFDWKTKNKLKWIETHSRYSVIKKGTAFQSRNGAYILISLPHSLLKFEPIGTYIIFMLVQWHPKVNTYIYIYTYINTYVFKILLYITLRT